GQDAVDSQGRGGGHVSAGQLDQAVVGEAVRDAQGSGGNSPTHHAQGRTHTGAEGNVDGRGPLNDHRALVVESTRAAQEGVVQHQGGAGDGEGRVEGRGSVDGQGAGGQGKCGVAGEAVDRIGDGGRMSDSGAGGVDDDVVGGGGQAQ